ncbi:malonyl-ACP O-methyltransferase BioC [Thiorhodospira sibirica]|uniref:malonyl-ACP O-methyltransferase BioC n=1 Tax=Thiorhodospira sibirica TaxID=154347 RepID=UPI00022C22DE|nr:malonyl-ACP O-methyltransferase BioC [Thiorhodospira sibirica]
MTQNPYHLDKRLVRHHFERAAPHYDHAAFLQREIAGRLLEHLRLIKKQPHRILDAGCGTGHAITTLHHDYPQAQIIALDLAVGMLRGVSRHHPANPQLSLLNADLEALPFKPDSFDLVFSNLALQWCNAPADTFTALHRVMRADGVLMFSTFGPDTLHELRSAFAALDPHTHVSAFWDMHDLGDMLLQAGFADPVMARETLTVTYADLSALLKDLKGIGATNATQGRASGLMGRARLAALGEQYQRFAHSDGRLPATYEILYGHAWRNVPAAAPTPGPVIPIIAQ